jgi:hypothetical protein
LDLAKERELIFMANPANPMSLTQALTIASLLCEWELETCEADATDWQWEVKTAHQVITQAINRPPAGEFFTSAPTRHRAGRKSNQVLV